MDAGFALADLLGTNLLGTNLLGGGARFVARVRSNVTARRSTLPVYKGRGRRPQRGVRVRPLARTRAGQTIAATPPDATASWTDGKHRLRAEVWDALVLPEVKPKAEPEAPTFRLVAIYDPRYRQPLLFTRLRRPGDYELASNLDVSAQALWRLYRDRWAIEQWPLSAKPMLGAERAFVFGDQSRYRLPELALLAGNVLSYVAATSAPVASGFWDRAARPTCGRMRRSLARINYLHFSELPCQWGQLRKKQSVTAHLKTAVEGHRRQKAVPTPSEAAQRT